MRAAVIAIVASAIAAASFAALGWRAATSTTTAGFWYDRDGFVLPADAAARLGGPLTQAERETIEQISRLQLERAFEGFRIRITQDRDAFWRVVVLPALRAKRRLPSAGETLGLGFLGGEGAVDFALVAFQAMNYAPPGASREVIVQGIGRGIGRVAAHEFAHQILGPHAPHNDSDPNSYEYPRPDRAAQYYGELHWTTAAPLLQRKIGK